MKIAVVSDIHYPKRLFSFPNVLGALTEFDLVIGLGDYVHSDVIDFIRSVSKKSFFVSGNADEPFIKSSYPSKLLLNIEGLSVGIIHGYGPPNNLSKRLLNEFQKIDLMLYGHSHITDDSVVSGTRVFNPGAFCETQSIGILSIENGQITNWSVECLN
jgi:hypothetical protein